MSASPLEKFYRYFRSTYFLENPKSFLLFFHLILFLHTGDLLSTFDALMEESSNTTILEDESLVDLEKTENKPWYYISKEDWVIAIKIALTVNVIVIVGSHLLAWFTGD